MTDFQDIMNRQKNQGRQKMERFWICVVSGVVAKYPHAHATPPEAQHEAERLAQLPDNQGKTVHLFECIGKCRVIKPMAYWEVPQ